MRVCNLVREVEKEKWKVGSFVQSGGFRVLRFSECCLCFEIGEWDGLSRGYSIIFVYLRVNSGGRFWIRDLRKGCYRMAGGEGRCGQIQEIKGRGIGFVSRFDGGVEGEEGIRKIFGFLICMIGDWWCFLLSFLGFSVRSFFQLFFRVNVLCYLYWKI